MQSFINCKSRSVKPALVNLGFKSLKMTSQRRSEAVSCDHLDGLGGILGQSLLFSSEFYSKLELL